jgi:hypothetical protein
MFQASAPDLIPVLSAELFGEEFDYLFQAGLFSCPTRPHDRRVSLRYLFCYGHFVISIAKPN